MKAKDLVEEIENELINAVDRGTVKIGLDESDWLEEKFALLKLKIADLQEVYDTHHSLLQKKLTFSLCGVGVDDE